MNFFLSVLPKFIELELGMPAMIIDVIAMKMMTAWKLMKMVIHDIG